MTRSQPLRKDLASAGRRLPLQTGPPGPRPLSHVQYGAGPAATTLPRGLRTWGGERGRAPPAKPHLIWFSRQRPHETGTIAGPTLEEGLRVEGLDPVPESGVSERRSWVLGRSCRTSAVTARRAREAPLPHRGGRRAPVRQPRAARSWVLGAGEPKLGSKTQGHPVLDCTQHAGLVNGHVLGEQFPANNAPTALRGRSPRGAGKAWGPRLSGREPPLETSRDLPNVTRWGPAARHSAPHP